MQGCSIREPEQSTHRRAQVIERAVHRYPANNFSYHRIIKAQSHEGSRFHVGYS